MSNSLSLIGEKFGSLTVVSRSGSDNRGNSLWLCICICGRERIRKGIVLRDRQVDACTCDLVKRSGYGTRMLSDKERLRSIWDGIMTRCYKENSYNYRYYGARGISICELWHSFEEFKDWSISNGYDKSLTIDRINPNGNYEPSNCRWVDKKTQSRNTRRASMLTVDGVTKHCGEWAELTGISLGAIRSRITLGWDPVDIITKPNKSRNF